MAAWRAGVVRYDVDFEARKVTYYDCNGEECVESYPAANVEEGEQVFACTPPRQSLETALRLRSVNVLTLAFGGLICHRWPCMLLHVRCTVFSNPTRTQPFGSATRLIEDGRRRHIKNAIPYPRSWLRV